MAWLQGLASHHWILRNFGCFGRLILPLHHQISWLPQHCCWSLYCQNYHCLGVHHLWGLHHQSQLHIHRQSHHHHGMWTCCIHGLHCWILLVILVQLFGNGCWMLSGSGTLLGWSCEVEYWSRIWLARMWMNVKLPSWQVKLLRWGQSWPHH